MENKYKIDEILQNIRFLGNMKSLKKNNVLRLIVFLIFALLSGILCLFLGLSWIFVSGMTYPTCRDPQHLVGLSEPEEHWLSTEDGHEIRVWYYPSKNGAAILSLGGLTGSLGAQLPAVKGLVKEGYGVLQIDSRACLDPSTPVTLGANEIYDAATGIEFLLAREEVDHEKIGVIGFSMGGATAIRAAARHPEIRAVIRDGGFSNLGVLLDGSDQYSSVPMRIFRKAIILIYQIQTDIDPWTVNPIGDLSKISPRPVLLIFGQYESEYGIEQFAAAGEGKMIWIVPGGRHGQNHLVAPEEYDQQILNFFDQSFGN